jgi:uncharacterized ubiquitin-like protein YukD
MFVGDACTLVKCDLSLTFDDTGPQVIDVSNNLSSYLSVRDMFESFVESMQANKFLADRSQIRTKNRTEICTNDGHRLFRTNEMDINR